MNLLYHSFLYCLLISSVVTICMEIDDDSYPSIENIKEVHRNAKRQKLGLTYNLNDRAVKRKLNFDDYQSKENEKWEKSEENIKRLSEREVVGGWLVQQFATLHQEENKNNQNIKDSTKNN